MVEFVNGKKYKYSIVYDIAIIIHVMKLKLILFF